MKERIIETTQGKFKQVYFNSGLEMVIEPGTDNEEKLYLVPAE